MEAAQAAKDAAANPASILAFYSVAWCLQPDPWAGVNLGKLLVEPVVEADYQRRATGDDDVGQKSGPHLDVDVAESLHYQLRNRLVIAWPRVFRILFPLKLAHLQTGETQSDTYHQRRLGVEQAFDRLEPFSTEHLVPSVGHLEGPAWTIAVHFVGVATELSAGPHLHHRLFEFSKHTLLFQPTE